MYSCGQPPPGFNRNSKEKKDGAFFVFERNNNCGGPYRTEFYRGNWHFSGNNGPPKASLALDQPKSMTKFPGVSPRIFCFGCSKPRQLFKVGVTAFPNSAAFNSESPSENTSKIPDDGLQCEPQHHACLNFLLRKLCISRQKERAIFRKENFGGSRI